MESRSDALSARLRETAALLPIVRSGETRPFLSTEDAASSAQPVGCPEAAFSTPAHRGPSSPRTSAQEEPERVPRLLLAPREPSGGAGKPRRGSPGAPAGCAAARRCQRPRGRSRRGAGGCARLLLIRRHRGLAGFPAPLGSPAASRPLVCPPAPPGELAGPPRAAPLRAPARSLHPGEAQRMLRKKLILCASSFRGSDFPCWRISSVPSLFPGSLCFLSSSSLITLLGVNFPS